MARKGKSTEEIIGLLHEAEVRRRALALRLPADRSMSGQYDWHST